MTAPGAIAPGALWECIALPHCRTSHEDAVNAAGRQMSICKQPPLWYPGVVAPHVTPQKVTTNNLWANRAGSAGIPGGVTIDHLADASQKLHTIWFKRFFVRPVADQGFVQAIETGSAVNDILGQGLAI